MLRSFSDEVPTSILPTPGLPSSMDPPIFRAKPGKAREAWTSDTTSVEGADLAGPEAAGGGGGRGGRVSGGSGSGGSSSPFGLLSCLLGGRGEGVGAGSLGFGVGSVEKNAFGHSNGEQSDHSEASLDDCSAEVKVLAQAVSYPYRRARTLRERLLLRKQFQFDR
mmetsp:Transcript_113498/g.367184  ORF Transcript_113498/g.367184 Transcript_113498/m.367184 type:complete len:165 (+) Transcript_113498:522-1016(+)